MKTTSNWSQWSGTDADWDKQLLEQENNCVYQTSSWGNHRTDFNWKVVRLTSGEQNSCQAQILTKSTFGTTIAWVPGGPIGDLIQLDKAFDQEILKITNSKKLYIRINALAATSQDEEHQLLTCGWKPVKKKFSTGISLNYSLDSSEIIRRELLSTNWNRNLRRGETRNTAPYEWVDYNAEEIADVYRQLSEYKDLVPDADTPSFQTIASLVNNCRAHLRIIRCDDEHGKALAIRGALTFGAKAWDIFAAVTPQGRKQYSSYVTAWTLLNSCADSKITNYDLSGIDPINNKGVYDFKHGTGAHEIKYLGEWDRGTPFFIQPLAGRLIRYRKKL